MTPEQARSLAWLGAYLEDSLKRLHIYRDTVAREGCPVKPFDDEIDELTTRLERVERWLTT